MTGENRRENFGAEMERAQRAPARQAPPAVPLQAMLNSARGSTTGRSPGKTRNSPRYTR